MTQQSAMKATNLESLEGRKENAVPKFCQELFEELLIRLFSSTMTPQCH